DLIPNSRGSLVRSYSNRVYSGQFSEDGSFFYSCSQDFKVRLFSTDKENLEEVKVVRADIGQWTITDATLSRNNKWLAYSSIAPIAYLTRTDVTDDIQSRLSFSNSRREEFGIWSLRFSSDGKEIVAGTSNRSIMILDIESKTVVFDQKGHRDDVNAVCFADDSSQIMFSGSDDSLIKVWDRRSMYGNDCSPAGTLVGHTAGLTFVASKGDGRYCISNSKDQSMKLWDIRKLVSVDRFDLTSHVDSVLQFDYRILSYPLNSPLTHPDDVSVMTYKGHEVLSTLIRCHFSPAASTGQKYLYTGSSNGKIHIYNLDGTVAQILDTNGAMRGGRSSGSSRSNRSGNYSHTKKVVRDVAWHPNYPIIIASCWDSGKGRLNKHIFTTDARGNGMSHKSESRYRTRSRAKNSHNY
ncbi:WD40 repeat-like protein, partial [Neoconidiobolus thromboides FSU 785]